tara:strand:- start:271 stop:816 length:546 start_codon:yes stop_codon:yes gene_type:complete
MNKTNKTIVPNMEQHLNAAALKRHNNIGEKLDLKLIHAEHLINLTNMSRGYDLCATFADNERLHYKSFYNNPSLKYFNGMDKWKLLIEIISKSSKGEIVYKEQLAKVINCSHKTLTKYIDECIEGGFFVYLNPVNKTVLDKRIINIRPSEEVIVAFINYSIEKIVLSIDLLKEFSKSWQKI